MKNQNFDVTKIMTDEQASLEIRKTSIAVRRMALIPFLLGITVAYFLWPSGIVDLTFSAITFGMFLRAIGAIFVIIIFSVAALLLGWDA